MVGQATPAEAGRMHGHIVGLIVLVVAKWPFAAGWFVALTLATLADLVVAIVSGFLHRPPYPEQDQEFAANEMAQRAESFLAARRWQAARRTIERALVILGHGQPKLGAALTGRLAIVNQELGRYPEALDNFKSALAMAEHLDDVSGQATRLHNIAALLADKLGNPTDAFPYAERAVAAARKLRNPEKLARSMTQLSKLHGELERIDLALSTANEAIEVAESAVDPNVYAEALHARGLAQVRKNDHRAARRDFAAASSALPIGSSEDLRGVLAQASSAAVHALSTGEPLQIVTSAQAEAASNGYDVPLAPEVEKVLDPALQRVTAGQTREAAEALLRALRNPIVKNDSTGHALAAMNAGDLLRTLGRAQEAVDILEPGIGAAIAARDATLECGCRQNLSLAFHVLGRFEDADREVTLALALADGNRDKQVKGRLLTTKGNLLRDTHQFEAAMDTYHAARLAAEAANDKPLLGSIAQSIGNLWVKRHDYDAAGRAFEDALAVGRELKDGVLQGKALHMLGNVLKRKAQVESDPAKQNALLSRAYETVKRSVEFEASTQDRTGTAVRIHSLGDLSLNLGKVTDAQSHYEKAIARYEASGTLGPDVADLRVRLGALLVHLGHAREGAVHLLAAHEIDTTAICQAFTLASESARLSLLKSAHGRLDDLLSLIVAGGPLENHRETIVACANAVIRRKGITAEAIALARDDANASTDPSTREKLAELAECRATLASLSLASVGTVWGKPATHEELTLSARRDRLERELSSLVPAVSLEQRLRAADCNTLAKRLPAATAVLEIVRCRVFDFPRPDLAARWSGARYLAFLIQPDLPDSIERFDLGDADEIDRQVRVFLEQVFEEGTQVGVSADAAWKGRGSYSTARDLYTKIISPLAHLLKRARTLIVAADWELGRLPLGILVDGDDTMLLDRYDVSYLGTARDSLGWSRPRSSHSHSVVVSAPDFDAKGTSAHPLDAGRPALAAMVQELEPLAGAKAEGTAIAPLLRANTMSGASATKKAMTELDSPLVLHVATHGFFLGGVDEHSGPVSAAEDIDSSSVAGPLARNGLVLAGANAFLRGEPPAPGAGDGFLTAQDVIALRLAGTELVVLSACDTGRGVIHIGEGVQGLRRAFALAGARSVIMSLWKVPDEQTQDLMVTFYEALLATGVPQGRTQALTSAQKGVRRKCPHPFYWAAFICEGERGPVHFTRP